MSNLSAKNNNLGFFKKKMDKYLRLYIQKCFQNYFLSQCKYCFYLSYFLLLRQNTVIKKTEQRVYLGLWLQSARANDVGVEVAGDSEQEPKVKTQTASRRQSALGMVGNFWNLTCREPCSQQVSWPGTGMWSWHREETMTTCFK